MAELLPWLNLLLMPICGLMLRIREDIASMRTLQAEQQRRLDQLERGRMHARPMES